MRQNYISKDLVKQRSIVSLYLFCLCISTSLFAQNTESENISEGATIYNPLNYLSYKQQTNTQKHYALGQYSVYSNAFTLEPLTDLKISVEGGTVLQQSFFSPLPPNVHLYYRAELSYALNDYLQPYIYNQHLSKPLGENPDNLRLNPFFIQSEFGTGVKTKMKNYLLETGVKTMTNPNIGEQSMQTQVFSKLSKSF
ncbi:hypothetical protein [uncultured Formosa sp.]|uniref:hypothetical protein n=1 Tax=uncultured Formosa sp. TaxID=255435 RepID=UPI002622722B|nr:hypothetical protein [uncultured Formosa sp.]